MSVLSIAMVSHDVVVKDLLHRLVAHPQADVGNDVGGSSNPMSMDGLREAVRSARAWETLLDEVQEANSLRLRNSSIGDEALMRLSEALDETKGPKLLNLDLSNNGITEQGFKVLTDAIQEGALRQLEDFNISRNPIGLIGESGMKLLAQILADGCLPSLQHLDLSFCSISEMGAVILAESLQSGSFSNWNLQYLNLSGNEFGGEGMTALSRVLIMGRLPNLRQFDLSYNKLDELGTAALVKAMKAGTLSDLTHLCLSRCALTDSLVGLLNAIELGMLTKLQHLDLSSNNLGDLGGVAFAAALSSGKVSQLRSLILARCTISANRMRLITEAIEEGHIYGLSHLDLSGISLDVLDANLDSQGSLALATLMERGHLRNLEYLNLSQCSLADDGVVALVKEMEAGKVPELEHLLMKDNDIQSERSLSAFVRALEAGAFPRLQELELGFNSIGDDVNMALATLLDRSSADGPVVRKLSEYLRSNRSPVDSPQTLNRLARVWRSFKSLRSHSLKGVRQLSLTHSSSKDLRALAQTLQRFNSSGSLEGFAIQGLSPVLTPKFSKNRIPRSFEDSDASNQQEATGLKANRTSTVRSIGKVASAAEGPPTQSTILEGRNPCSTEDTDSCSSQAASSAYSVFTPASTISGRPFTGYELTQPSAAGSCEGVHAERDKYQSFESIGNTEAPDFLAAGEASVQSADNDDGNFPGPFLDSEEKKQTAPATLSFQGFDSVFEPPTGIPWFKAHSFSKADSFKALESSLKDLTPHQPVVKQTTVASSPLLYPPVLDVNNRWNPAPGSNVNLPKRQSTRVRGVQRQSSRKLGLQRQSSQILGLGLDGTARGQNDVGRNDKFFFNVILICVWIFAVFVSRS